MKKYLSFFRMRFLMGLQYRAAAAAGIVTQFTWGFMELLVFRAFYQADASAFPMSFEAVIMICHCRHFCVHGMDDGSREIFSSIVDGNSTMRCAARTYLFDVVCKCRNRVSKALLRCAPI